MGARFSNAVLQTLLVLFSRRPPKVCQVILSVLVHTTKLQQIGLTFAFIIASSSLRSILTDLGLSEPFDSDMRTSNFFSPCSRACCSRGRAVPVRTRSKDEQSGCWQKQASALIEMGMKKLLSIIEMD
jgi:vesicle-fusing ATPase